eukprot:m.42220 g.42220  ORF g.42220 m.42220 type:complete len:171 (+) comp6080_c0_seq1:2-514(+)
MVLFSLPRENLAAMWIAGCGIGRAHSTRPPCAAHFHLASISPYPALLHKYQMASQWGDAIRLARFVKDDKIWASLATMAAAARELDTAEMAYAAIDEVDKVEYIQHIKQIPTVEGRNAAMALFCKQVCVSHSARACACVFFPFSEPDLSCRAARRGRVNPAAGRPHLPRH